MDITILFKACVKTVRATNKDLGVVNIKPNLLKITKDTNMIKPREILKHLTNLHSFFEENKVEYLNIMNHVSSNNNVKELDRDQIDTVTQKILNTCASMIKEYREEIKQLKISKQKLEHYCNVSDFIEIYLKDVSKLYTNTKTARIKRIIENSKISKLESSFKPLEKKNIEQTTQNMVNVKTNDSVLLFDQSILSAEEMQMFEAENELLYNELNSLSDEVNQMESKVVKIAELQELFTEKVLQQEKDIDRIAHTVASTTDNVRDANEQIRQAIQRNAGLRVTVLFFLLIMSFSLLFLDWYNV